MNGLLTVHVGAGGVALLSGAAALAARKGGRLHTLAGSTFVAAMYTMAGMGFVLAAAKAAWPTAAVATITLYLVATGSRAARRREAEAGHFELAGLLVIVFCMAAQATFALFALAAPDGQYRYVPYQALIIFAALSAFAAMLDLGFLRRKTLSARQRIGRHLWRIAAAMLIATTSFFQGQQQHFPEAWRDSPVWNVPPLAVLVVLLFWAVRNRLRPARGAAVVEDASAVRIGAS